MYCTPYDRWHTRRSSILKLNESRVSHVNYASQFEEIPNITVTRKISNAWYCSNRSQVILIVFESKSSNSDSVHSNRTVIRQVVFPKHWKVCMMEQTYHWPVQCSTKGQQNERNDVPYEYRFT